MVTGVYMQLPEAGGVLDQNDYLMRTIEIAQRCWLIWHWKPKREIALTTEDADFITWVLKDD